MARVTAGVETYLLYLAALWLCGEFGWAAKPGPGCSGKSCCSGGAGPLASGNKCSPDQCCSNTRCDACRPVPECKEGDELQCSGTIDFSFVCKECPPGTFSDSKMDCCIPWTDCSLNGFQTIRQGNRTHNVQCGNSVIVERDSTFTSVLAILTAAGIFLIIFMMVFLLLCMWTQKAAKVPVMEDPEAVDAAKFLQRPQQREDSVSCQYPEEEHGHKMAEEKDSTLFLAH